jgi:hypothetical protein
MSQGPSSGNIDLGFMFTNTLFRDVQQSGIPEPTPAVWSHVAYVADGGGDTKVYYNGVLRGTMVNPGALSNGSSDLNIGRRAGVNGQGYLGKLAMIRISTTAKYVANFSPSLSYGAGADTRLMLGSDTPLTDSVGTHPISVQGAVTVSDDFPSFRSLEFVENQGDYLDVAGSSDWNLGTTWTIEFWLKANAASATAGGGIWGLLNQVGWSTTNAIVVALSDNKLVFLSGSNANEDVRYTEPTPGVWTHVAIVNNAGTQTVWYNGVEQTKVSGTFGTASYTNSTDPLRIGRLGPANGGTLNGKMAMVRISNSAKYSAAFTATTTYNFETGTKLFLSKFTPTIDTVQHTITNNGVATSTDLPQTFIDHPHPNTGGTLVATFCLFGDPNITAFAAIPVGARITSNIPGFGIRLVTASAPHVTGRIITYDGTGLSGTSSTSDRYNFYW